MIESSVLIDLAMRRLSLGGPTELARALNLGGQHDVQRVGRWLRGRNEPDYEATVALLDLLGAVRWDALSPDDLGSPEVTLEEIRRDLDRTRQRVRQLEALLREREGRQPGRGAR